MDRPPAPPIPLEADERTMLLAFLDFYRAELRDRAWGLDAAQLDRQHPPTTLTIARLLSHMAWVEEIWFRVRLDGDDFGDPWATLDWDADDDAEMTHGEQLGPDELVALYDRSIDDSNRRIAAATSLDQRSVGTNRDGDHWSLRWILVHMIEEYARHCGHADLIRESIDGDTAA